MFVRFVCAAPQSRPFRLPDPSLGPVLQHESNKVEKVTFVLCLVGSPVQARRKLS